MNVLKNFTLLFSFIISLQVLQIAAAEQQLSNRFSKKIQDHSTSTHNPMSDFSAIDTIPEDAPLLINQVESQAISAYDQKNNDENEIENSSIHLDLESYDTTESESEIIDTFLMMKANLLWDFDTQLFKCIQKRKDIATVNNPIIKICKNNDMPFMKIVFLEYYKDCASFPFEKRRPLALSVGYNNIEMVLFLLKAGVDINECGSSGWTALHESYYCRNKKIAAFLIAAGADQSLKDRNGLLPHQVKVKDTSSVACSIS